jgi:excisionase family DNA binding protein
MSAVTEATRLSLHEAAAELGVHYQTAYRWVRRGVLPAVKIGGAYEVERAAIAALQQDRSAPSPPPAHRRVRNWETFAARLHAALMVGDESKVRDLFEDLVTSGVSIADVCDRVLVPALVRIGDQWMRGEISIAEEHRASAICERALGRWSPSPPGRPRGVAVVCSPTTDEHQLPGQMATAALREQHWRVHHLGVGVPADALKLLVEDEHADLVVISLAWPPALAEAHELAAALEAPGRRVVVGGPGRSIGGLISELGAPPSKAARA